MSRIARSDSEEFVDDGDEQDFVSSTVLRTFYLFSKANI